MILVVETRDQNLRANERLTVHTLGAASRPRSDPTATDPSNVYQSAHTPDPIAKQQTAGILSELGAEEESFSREVFGRRSFEDGGERHRDDAEKDDGEGEGGENGEDENRLDVIRSRTRAMAVISVF